MAFRQYTVGARMFGFALGSSMMITLFFPSIDIRNVTATESALDRQLQDGWDAGFNLTDPLLKGDNKPMKVLLTKDPKTGAALPPGTYAYVYRAGTWFPSGIIHPVILGEGVSDLTVSKGRVGEADKGNGAVFMIKHAAFNGQDYPYIEDVTATEGWTPDAVMSSVPDANVSHAGAGKTMFVREGCWWCHTLLPEETQDWQAFGVPPMLGDFNGASPTSFGSDRKAPDLLHVASRNSSREWLMMHFFNPRLVQPHSIMPRFDYLWGDKDANGNTIDFDKWRAEYDEYHEGRRDTPPDVPMPAQDSEIRNLLDFMLSLK